MKGIAVGITGASGLIGSKLYENLLKNGYSIRINCNPDNYINPNIKTYKIDLLNPDLKITSL